MKTLARKSYELGQIHALRELLIYFDVHGKLPKFPISDEDWYPAWTLFDGSFSEEYPYYNETIKDISWKSYKNGWIFAYNYIEEAIKIIQENIKDYVYRYNKLFTKDEYFDENVGTYLKSLPEVDDELIIEYTNTLSRLYNAILKQYQ